MELIEELEKALLQTKEDWLNEATGPMQGPVIPHQAFACLPVFERWLRESSGKYNTACDCVECSRARRYMRGLADQIAAMAKEAKG